MNAASSPAGYAYSPFKTETCLTINTHPVPVSVNFHFWKPCNYGCKFCFATFHDDDVLRGIGYGLPVADCIRIVSLLREAGIEKLNFVGGEPTLSPDLPKLLHHSRASGLVTSMVTNGSRLDSVLDTCRDCLDWVGLSIDSANEDTQAALGRGKGNHVYQTLCNADRLHQDGIRIKLNTVVTSLTWQEDMSELVLKISPQRWKCFEVLPVMGQNHGRVEPLLITPGQFQAFVNRHQPLCSQGINIVPETNDDMTGSYAMIDPAGRFFSNASGSHNYSRPILEVGVQAAFGDVAYDHEKYIKRGAIYDWQRHSQGQPVTISIER